MNRRTLLGAAAATAVAAAIPRTGGQAATTQPAAVRWNWLAALTPRERQAAVLLARGLTIREIAQLFGISRRTLEVGICRIYRKLGISTRSELVEITRGVSV